MESFSKILTGRGDIADASRL